ncbi:hypothetical protein LguiA_008187 [Lonicera macranthoides]
MVISKDYTSSTWCLDELLLILERRKIFGHVVLPMFYDVDPSQVRKQTGRIAEVFARYEKQFKAETNSKGKIKLMEKIKAVHLVLDDVEKADQIYAISRMQDWLFPGSKVFITTRHERLLKPHKIYKVEKLGQDESIKLFSFHAFGADLPLKSYTKKTKRAVQICEGLPLVLKVVGRKTVEGLTLDMLMLKEAGNNAKKCHYEEFCAKSILLKHASTLKRRCLSLLSGQSNLVTLDLRHSRFEQVWKQTPFLGSLKILDLSYCNWLARTPNFLGLPNLKRLILKGCVSLVEVYESIGNLKMLDLLDLQYCNTLRKLPRNIGKLGSLKTLIISGCNIGELPSEMRNMQSLEVLTAERIIINPVKSVEGSSIRFTMPSSSLPTNGRRIQWLNA